MTPDSLPLIDIFGPIVFIAGSSFQKIARPFQGPEIILKGFLHDLICLRYLSGKNENYCLDYLIKTKIVQDYDTFQSDYRGKLSGKVSHRYRIEAWSF